MSKKVETGREDESITKPASSRGNSTAALAMTDVLKGIHTDPPSLMPDLISSDLAEIKAYHADSTGALATSAQLPQR